MAELQEANEGGVGGGSINGGGGPVIVGPTPFENQQQQQQGPPSTSKRQRRPSVRLGDIGDQPAATLSSYDSSYLLPHHHHHHHHHQRNNNNNKHLWNQGGFKYRHPSHFLKDPKSSKTRPLTNLTNNNTSHDNIFQQTNNHKITSSGDASNKKSNKPKRGGGGTGLGLKKLHSNWGVSRIDEDDEKFSVGGDDGDEEGLREEEDPFDPEGGRGGGGGSDSDKEEEEEEHLLLPENPNLDLRQNTNRVEGAFIGGQKRKQITTRARARTRTRTRTRTRGVSAECREDDDGVEFDAGEPMPSSDNEATRSYLEDGVRMWLNGLGLGQYAHVFGIHQVDEEVLPLLTLEDLKDMGVNAVGSRRKMYSAIEKLRRGFS